MAKQIINILELEPSVINRGLKGKYICVYGLPKVGKTTFASQCPNNLLLGFEHGWNALAGVKAVDITSWADFKLVLNQLKKPEAQEMYETITIDTVGLAWNLCEDYICAKNGVASIGDIPWGAGYSLCTKEFAEAIKKITQLGYGLVIIAHVDKKTIKMDDETEVIQYGPAIPKRCYNIVNQLVDIIGYIDVVWEDDGKPHRYLYTRSTPNVMAGTRFAYLKTKIPFGYNELVNAVNDAIDKEAEMGSKVVNSETTQEFSYEDLMLRAKEMWEELVAQDPENSIKITNICEEVSGEKRKISSFTPEEKSLLEHIVLKIQSLY